MRDELLDLPQNLLLHGIPLQQLGDKLLNCEIFYSLKEVYMVIEWRGAFSFHRHCIGRPAKKSQAAVFRPQ
jgi:hypothetical protein